MRYELTTWTPNDEGLLIDPHYYVTESREEFLKTLDKAEADGFDFEYFVLKGE